MPEETYQRPNWWTPTVIGLLFAFVLGIIAPSVIGIPLIIAALIMGMVLSRWDYRQRAEYFRKKIIERDEVTP